MNSIKINALVLFCFISSVLFAQNIPGVWKDYFSYRQAFDIISVENDLFVLSDNGIYIYNTTNNEIQTLSTVQGLSSTSPSTIIYSKSTNEIYIGYLTGEFDIISYPSLKVKSINAIAQKNITGSKAINKFCLFNNNIYIATEFGIVEFDIIKKEFGSTAILGDDGTFIPINDIDVENDSIFVASDHGIYTTSINQNIADASLWNKLEGSIHSNTEILGVEYINNKIYYYFKTGNDPLQDSTYVYSQNKTEAFKTQLNNIHDIKSISDSLVICGRYNARVYYNDMLRFAFDTSSTSHDQNNFQNITLHSDGDWWVADGNNGILNTNTEKLIQPDGPYSNLVADIYLNGSTLYMVAGRDNLYQIGMFSMLLENGKWYSHVNWNAKNSKTVYALPNSEKYYYGTNGWGLVEGSNSWIYDTIYNIHNSTIQNIYSDSSNYQYISAITSDVYKNIWMTNKFVDKPILVKDRDGKWYSYSIPQMEKMSFTLNGILIDKRGYKWITGANRLIVFNENKTLDDTSDDEYVIIPLTDSEGEIATLCTCIAEDQNGQIWIGTSEGIAYHASPSRVFNDKQSITRKKIEIDGEVGYLLSSDRITTIVVDGANRKWVGTENSGVFLFSADGSEQIANYNMSNSPIPTNFIAKIAINNNTGEVFIGSEFGIVSLIGEATAGNNDGSNIEIIPNPVRESYSSNIYIKNVPTNAIIKITTISGKLVNEFEALGGTGVWNGLNLYGDKVSTGVYLVYVTNEDGSITDISKLLVVN